MGYHAIFDACNQSCLKSCQFHLRRRDSHTAATDCDLDHSRVKMWALNPAVNFYAVATLIALLLRQRNGRRPKRTVWTKQWVSRREEQGIVQNLQRELVLVEPSNSFSAFPGCVIKAGISFHIATSASSFSGVQGFLAMLATIFESKLNDTCCKVSLSLVVWRFSVACCRAFTTHLREKKQLPSMNCNSV